MLPAYANAPPKVRQAIDIEAKALFDTYWDERASPLTKPLWGQIKDANRDAWRAVAVLVFNQIGEARRALRESRQPRTVLPCEELEEQGVEVANGLLAVSVLWKCCSCGCEMHRLMTAGATPIPHPALSTPTCPACDSTCLTGFRSV